ncbi:MAG: hypothetical protein JW749_07355 [Sedimentisphaerales bacterium]|nr:hypothetical protein [Sedimentisphaerales bacterium]
MIDLHPNHCEVVKETLAGRRTTDEQTLSSVAVLSERLERVKKLGQRFSRIEFSPSVKELKSRSGRMVTV